MQQSTARHLAPVIAAVVVIGVRILCALLTILTAPYVITSPAPKWSPTFLTDTFIWSLFSFLVGLACRVWADERCFLTGDSDEPFVRKMVKIERYASVVIAVIIGACGLTSVIVPTSLNPMLWPVAGTFGMVIAYPIVGRTLRKREWL